MLSIGLWLIWIPYGSDFFLVFAWLAVFFVDLGFLGLSLIC